MIIRFLHITLAVFLFFSTTGLTINSHFCSGKYKYSALFVQPTNCCAKVQNHQPTEGSCQDEFNKTPCCQNKASFVKSNHNQYLSDASVVEFELPVFQAIISTSLFSNINYQWLDIDYLNYKPPLIAEDISILYQVFRC